MRIYRSTDRESFGKKSDIANGSILCHYAEQLYLVAWFRCRRQRCGGTETAGCPGTCGRDYRSDPGAWAGRFVSYRKHARFEKLLDLSSFAHLAIGSNSFRVTDVCISCGLCERICPTGTISMQAGKPVWTDTCVQCVACIHRCPVRAIEYGKGTLKKGRYHHPEIK